MTAVMTETAVDLLDRQHERFQAAGGAEFVHELRRFYEFITAGPAAVVSALAELRAEASEVEERFAEHDRELVPELVQLKVGLVARVPEADDSGVPRPIDRFSRPDPAWAYGFANFDQVATGGPDRSVTVQKWDTSASGMLLSILETKLKELQWVVTTSSGVRTTAETNLRPDLDDLGLRLRNLNDRHRHAAQEFNQAVERDGGFQVQFLDMAIGQLTPAPREIQTEDEQHARMDELFKRVLGGWHVLEDAAAGRPLDEQGRKTLAIHIEKLKSPAEHVYSDLRLKVAMAPPPPEPTAGYGVRLRSWVLSPAYALSGGPCIGGALTGLVSGQHAGLGVFVALALGLALLPPFASHPPAVSYTTSSLAFAGFTTGAVVVLLVKVGVLAAVAAFALLAIAFALGQRARET
jgi:hypothetical protein